MNAEITSGMMPSPSVEIPSFEENTVEEMSVPKKSKGGFLSMFFVEETIPGEHIWQAPTVRRKLRFGS